MTRFDTYILKHIARPMGVALVLALIVLLIERMLRLFDLVLGSSGPLGVVFEILAYLVPHYMSMALPISLFLGVLIAFNRLSRDGELEALYSAGAGLARLARPALLAGGVLMILSAIIVGYLQPYARYAYQSMVFAITNTSFHAFLRSGVFVEAEGTTLLIDEIRPDGVGFARIFLYEQKENGEVDVVTAREGRLGYAESETTPLLKLVDGVRLTLKDRESNDTEEDDPASISVLDFDVSRTNLGQKAAELFRQRGKDEREFTLTELWERRFDPPPNVRSADMIAEFNGRIVKILSVVFLVFLAIPLSLGRRRSERSFGMAIGLVVLVVYNQVLDLGENMTETGEIEPWLGLWLPFGVFAIASLYLFYRASDRVPGSPSFGILFPNLRRPGFLLSSRATARKKGS